MAVRSEFLALMREQERDLDALFRAVAERIGILLMRFVAPDGKIPLERQRELRSAISGVLSSSVLNVTQGNFSAWRVNNDGSIEPTTPYFRILWETMTDAMRLAVKEQADIMTARMSEFLVARLRVAFLDPFAVESLPLAERRTLRRYQHPLVARRSDGRQLDQRLQVAMVEMVRKTTRLVDQWVFEQKAPAEIETLLQRYFSGDLPQPDSVRGAMELRRIARSEPLFAFSLASVAAAATNPYVLTVYVERGRSVPCSICDPIAAKSPYPIDEVLLPGYHSHCFCGLRYVTEPAARFDVNDALWQQTVGALNSNFINLLLKMQRNRGE